MGRSKIPISLACLSGIFFIICSASAEFSTAELEQRCRDNNYCLAYCLSTHPSTETARCGSDLASCICINSQKQAVKVRFITPRDPVPPTQATTPAPAQRVSQTFINSQSLPNSQYYNGNHNSIGHGSGQQQPPSQKRIQPTPVLLECDASEASTKLCHLFCTVEIRADYGLCNITSRACACFGVPLSAIQKEPITALFHATAPGTPAVPTPSQHNPAHNNGQQSSQTPQTYQQSAEYNYPSQQQFQQSKQPHNGQQQYLQQSQYPQQQYYQQSQYPAQQYHQQSQYPAQQQYSQQQWQPVPPQHQTQYGSYLQQGTNGYYPATQTNQLNQEGAAHASASSFTTNGDHATATSSFSATDFDGNAYAFTNSSGTGQTEKQAPSSNSSTSTGKVALTSAISEDESEKDNSNIKPSRRRRSLHDAIGGMDKESSSQKDAKLLGECTKFKCAITCKKNGRAGPGCNSVCKDDQCVCECASAL